MNRQILQRILLAHVGYWHAGKARYECVCGNTYVDEAAWAVHVTDAIYPR